MTRVEFHGTVQAHTELLAALGRNCTCTIDPETGGTITRCPGHSALVTDQKWLDHMEFARWLHALFTAEEFLEDSP